MPPPSTPFTLHHVGPQTSASTLPPNPRNRDEGKRGGGVGLGCEVIRPWGLMAAPLTFSILSGRQHLGLHVVPAQPQVSHPTPSSAPRLPQIVNKGTKLAAQPRFDPIPANPATNDKTSQQSALRTPRFAICTPQSPPPAHHFTVPQFSSPQGWCSPSSHPHREHPAAPLHKVHNPRTKISQ